MPRDTKPPALHTRPLIGPDLHVWIAHLDRFSERLEYFESLLSGDEKARTRHFYFERDRDRYMIGRGVLRTLLAGYLGIDAANVCFTYGPQRKPELASSAGENTLHFNLAHSSDWAVYVFGQDRPLGIDLEHVRPMPDVDDLVQRFFSARESRLIHTLSSSAKWEMFFTIWTCKEALLKAYGSGLTVPLDRFEISLEVENTVTVRSTAEDEAQLADWHVQTIELVDGYRSAIAVKGEIGRIIIQPFMV